MLPCLVLWRYGPRRRWYLVQRSGLEIGRNILIEIWEGNLTNLFATPLTLLEIMIALMSLGLIQAIITFFYTLVIILLFYGYNIFLFIPSLLPFMILFILFGWTIGLLITSIIFIYGKTVDTLAWGALWFFAIIGGAFYPIKLYPWWLARFAYFFPHTYLFEGVRAMIMNQTSPVYYLSMGFILGIIYFKCSYMILVWAFNKSKKNGLSQLIS